jgi:phage terminase large subunit
MNIQTTEIYELLEKNKDRRLLLFQGSARSGKTYNILIWLVIHLIQNPNITLSIVRKTLPALKGSVLRDLKEILENLNLYTNDKWKKQEGYFELPNRSVIEWFSTDEEQKLRGRKRDMLFINEANEITRDEYTQLAIRTTGQIIMDYNPSDLYSYIYDLQETEENVFFHKSTYKENPFLTEQVIKEIEGLKNKDTNLWRVFGLGERGVATNSVFSHHNIIPDEVFPKDGGEVVRGLDAGYNDPTAIVEVRIIDDKLFIKELLYARGLTSNDLAYRIEGMGFDRTDYLYCDSSRPEIIEDLKRKRINAKPVIKNTILHGIDLIKRHEVYIHEGSQNIIDEFQNYKWKTDKDGRILDVPEDKWNHAIDAIRYAMEMNQKPKTKYSFK